MKPIVRLAIIGCGMISRFHIDAIRQIKTAELAGVYDPRTEAAERAAAEQGVRAYRSLDELWNDRSVDAVCICTPSGTHGALAIDALRHGKHVLVEKPMALIREECRTIFDESRKNGLQAGVVSQLRFSPGVQLVKQAVEQGRLGRLVSTELNMKYYREESYFSASAWRGTKSMDGGGALMNQGIHGVDLLQYIAGMPARVFGQSRTLVHDIEVEDTLHAMLMYENGALGSVIATTSVYPGFARRLTVCGEEGTIELEEDRIAVWKLKDGSMPPELAGADISGSSDPASIGMQGHVRQLENFAAAIRGEEPLLVDAAEGCKPLAVIWGIYEASEKGRVITI